MPYGLDPTFAAKSVVFGMAGFAPFTFITLYLLSNDESMVEGSLQLSAAGLHPHRNTICSQVLTQIHSHAHNTIVG